METVVPVSFSGHDIELPKHERYIYQDLGFSHIVEDPVAAALVCDAGDGCGVDAQPPGCIDGAEPATSGI